MKKFFTLCFWLFSFTFAENILSNGDMEYGDGGWYIWNNPNGPAEYSGSAAIEKVGFNKSRGVKITVKKKPADWWGLQIQAPKFLADTCFYELKFKAKGDGSINAAVQGGAPDYRQKMMSSFVLTKEWKTYSMKFYADEKGYGLNNVVFQVGFFTGNVYLDDVEITPIENVYDYSWYASAEARIDSIRKKEFTLSGFKSGEVVEVELLRHEFPFGTALALYDSDDSVETWYRKMANKYFWYGVPENQFKWPEYEPEKGKLQKKQLNEYFEFAEKNGWNLRAHTLVWGIQKYNYDKHFGNLGTCAEISENIKKRIERDLKEYKGKFQEYDVWNEPLHETFLFDKCGIQLLDSAFVWAHRTDPEAVLYINDYNVVSSGETERYYALIESLLKRKIPVHGIGVQCHFNGMAVEPALIKERLDRLSELKLPIKVTEFDLGANFTEEEQAIATEKFIRTVFSHKNVSGIVFWGFYDGRHWLPGSGILDIKGREKQAAKVVYDLWHKTWTTKEKLKATPSGKIHFKGFPGKYLLKTASGIKTVELKSR